MPIVGDFAEQLRRQRQPPMVVVCRGMMQDAHMLLAGIAGIVLATEGASFVGETGGTNSVSRASIIGLLDFAGSDAVVEALLLECGSWRSIGLGAVESTDVLIGGTSGIAASQENLALLKL